MAKSADVRNMCAGKRDVLHVIESSIIHVADINNKEKIQSGGLLLLTGIVLGELLYAFSHDDIIHEARFDYSVSARHLQKFGYDTQVLPSLTRYIDR